MSLHVFVNVNRLLIVVSSTIGIITGWLTAISFILE